MKRLFLCSFVIFTATFWTACGGATNTNINVSSNRASNVNAPVNVPATNSVANANSSASMHDSFWSAAAVGGMAEVELGRLASTKAQNAEVKKFGEMMVTDHSKANDELKSIAAKNNITIPTSLDSSHQSLLQKMQGLSGADFDREYVEEMVSDHEEDVEEFEKQSQNNSDPEAKAFATKTLPTLRKHLDAIKAIQAKMK